MARTKEKRSFFIYFLKNNIVEIITSDAWPTGFVETRHSVVNIEPSQPISPSLLYFENLQYEKRDYLGVSRVLKALKS